MNITRATQTTIAQKTEAKPVSQARVLLHLEGLTIFIGAIMLYAHINGNWLLFGALILAPDLSFFAYGINKQVGSMVYNAVHLTTIPAILLAIGLATETEIAVTVSIIWFAHIYMDRAVGYGFKYITDFKDTHMSRV